MTKETPVVAPATFRWPHVGREEPRQEIGRSARTRRTWKTYSVAGVVVTLGLAGGMAFASTRLEPPDDAPTEAVGRSLTAWSATYDALQAQAEDATDVTLRAREMGVGSEEIAEPTAALAAARSALETAAPPAMGDEPEAAAAAARGAVARLDNASDRLARAIDALRLAICARQVELGAWVSSGNARPESRCLPRGLTAAISRLVAV